MVTPVPRWEWPLPFSSLGSGYPDPDFAREFSQ